MRWLHRLGCVIFFHDLVVVQEFSSHSRKLLCGRCGNYYAMNDHLHIFRPWDAELENLYANVFELGRTLR